ncbi:MAG: dihydropteroate synthase, partial [Planctomycetes bacterium]|nr:dihydropteroate synthase [Planctomycetota bacterium]
QFAQEQTAAGAGLLDVNMGMPGIDERAMLVECTRLLSTLTPCPLCIDTADPEAMEAALRLYPGRALVNSVSAERVRLEKMLPVAAKYGAMVIVLPVTDEGVPETLPARQQVALKVIDAAEKCGYHRDDLVIDGVVMTVSSSPEAPRVTADFIAWCANELGMATTGGVSNVSFGMPSRECLNAGFLGMLIGRGLTAALINPSKKEMMDLKFATDALLDRDPKFKAYLSKFAVPAPGAPAPAASGAAPARTPVEKAYDAVLYGDGDDIAAVLQAALDAGAAPQALIDEGLLPAINKVGELYEKKTYFLPQLMMSASALSAGFKFLEPLLTKDAAQSGPKAKMIMATVKGDIHDIGKNIVCLLLRNYGFEVIDLGKDVDEKTIVETALRENVTLVGLSALMTTTMTEMKTVIDYAKTHGGGHLKFMIGGAVVDQHYADEIGADGYSADAVDAVKLAKRLSGLPE